MDELDPHGIRRLRRTRRRSVLWAAAFASPLLLLLPSTVQTEDPLAPIARARTRPRLAWQESRIQHGETLSTLLGRWGVGPRDVAAIVEASAPALDLHRLRAGVSYAVAIRPDGRLARWRYELDRERSVVVSLEQGEPELIIEEHPFERRPEAASVTIRDSLFASLSPDGSRDELPLEIAEIFAWQVDFHHDLRAGDEIEVLFESLERNGRAHGVGRVLFAALTLSGKRLEAWFHEREDGRGGYYDREGRSLKKQFLRAPVEYGRISSGFSHRRFHPVLGRHRPHYGVDFAAPTGTPIRATADGVVVKTARGRGEGNHVVLRHANGFETWYLHMSRFERGLRRGNRVQQGETIGYVGSTGFATGPHVDYRMRRNGTWLNPSKATVPPAPPLEGAERARFERDRSAAERTFVGLLEATPGEPTVTAG